jgi:hypothetical protein
VRQNKGRFSFTISTFLSSLKAILTKRYVHTASHPPKNTLAAQEVCARKKTEIWIFESRSFLVLFQSTSKARQILQRATCQSPLVQILRRFYVTSLANVFTEAKKRCEGSHNFRKASITHHTVLFSLTNPINRKINHGPYQANRP